MKDFRRIRLGLYSAILFCVALFQFTAKSSGLVNGQGSSSLNSTLSGHILLHKSFHSALLQNSRDIIVYLPPDYRTSTSRRYPVLYMLDGQNIFDVRTSFFNHKERHMDEFAQKLIAEQAIQPLI